MTLHLMMNHQYKSKLKIHLVKVKLPFNLKHLVYNKKKIFNKIYVWFHFSIETPRIEPQLTDQQVILNQPLILKTNVYGRPKVDIQWLKDQKPIASSDRIKIERNNDECILTIANIKEEDIGTYTLSAKNKVGKVDSILNVKVTASLKFTNQLNDLDIIQGSNGVLSVECEGVPKPKLTWYVNRRHQLNNVSSFF